MDNKISIVTFNVRCVWDTVDGINNFIHRGTFICNRIHSENPDVISFQEVVPPILDFLKRNLPEYDFYGQYRSANYDGEGLFTAIKKERFDVVGFETIWLSPTPYISGSRYENQSPCPRICSMTQLRHKKSDRLIRVYNLHLDHASDEARVLGMETVLKFVDEYNAKLQIPSVILGDFNAEPDSKTIDMCNSRRDFKDVTADIPVTFHNFGKMEKGVKIDYIYVSTELTETVESVKAWVDQINGVYLSDHYPVCAKFEI